MEQSEAGINAHSLLQNSVIWSCFFFYRNPSLTVFLVWLYTVYLNSRGYRGGRVPPSRLSVPHRD